MKRRGCLDGYACGEASALAGRAAGRLSKAYIDAVSRASGIPSARLPLERLARLERGEVPPHIAARLVKETRA